MGFWEKLFSTESIGETLPLFVEGTTPFDFSKIRTGIIITDELPLYTIGAYIEYDRIPLVLTGQGFPANDFLPLVCWNNGTPGELPLYISGEGITDDALPINNTLLLFIMAPFGAQLPLYTHGGPQPSANADLPLYLSGGITITDSLNLVIPNVFGTNNDILTLYTHGF